MAAWTVLHPLLLCITSPVFWAGDGNISSPDSIEKVLLALLTLVPLIVAPAAPRAPFTLMEAGSFPAGACCQHGSMHFYEVSGVFR